MKTIAFILLLMAPFALSAQFYFNEWKSPQELEARMKNYIDQKVTSIAAVGYDERGARTRDFNEWHQINADTKTWYSQSRNGQVIVKMAYRFNANGKLASIADTSSGVVSLAEYRYDTNNRLQQVNFSVTDSSKEFTSSSVHQWFYSDSQQPVRLLKIENGKDSTEYRFQLDQQGRVSDEQLFRRNTGFDQIYYYYNSDNNLTDIVRYNKRLKKLLPDFMFEYDEEDRVIQKIATLSTRTSDYIIWRYAYNDKGLRTREALFNKQKELTGRIDYSYTFLQ